MPRYRSAVMSASLLALTLAGCNKSPQDMSATNANSGLPALPAALPMQTGPASQLTVAPPVSALPTRRYVSVSRPANQRESYAYLDRASDIEDEIGDAPPDYDYDNNDGVSPWVWETGGGDYRYAEPVDGGYRYYYYQPGEDHPYLVRSRDHSYAYAGGALVAIYALSGALLPPDRYGGYRDEASRYFSRGQELRQASDQREHQGVVAANWAAQRAQFSAAQANWAASRAQQAEWQAYHAQNDPSQQPGWQQEHQQRQQVAQQFAGWQSRGLTGAPPPVLAAAGTRAAPPREIRQQGMAGPQGLAGPQGFAGPQGLAGPQGFAGPQGIAGREQAHRRDMAGPQGFAAMPNNGVQAAALREQQLAAQREAQHQELASQRMAQEASRAQQEAAAQRQAGAARQQQFPAREAQQRMVADVHRQQDMAAREQVAAHQQMQQREAQLADRQAQLHAVAAQRQAEIARVREAQLADHQVQLHAVAAQRQAEIARVREAQLADHQAQSHAVAAQRQAEIARVRASRPEPQALMRERSPVPAAPRAAELAPRPEAPRAPAPAPRPMEMRPPAVHVEAPHPEPGHENEHHQQ